MRDEGLINPEINDIYKYMMRNYIFIFLPYHIFGQILHLLKKENK